MRALIRNNGETVTEEMGIAGIDWNTGYPLTGPNWFGGAYTLVQNYIPPVDDAPEQYEIVEGTPTPAAEEPEVEVVPDSNVVIIDGKEYTKEELRALLGE